MKTINVKKENRNKGKTKKETIKNNKNTHNIKINKKDNNFNSKIKENKKDEKEINNSDRPEDISDYISIDEYNKNEFIDLNSKITNEAIEEVEEAKEVSELRQSSEFYNNMSNSKSNQQQLNPGSIKDISKKSTYNTKNQSINRCLTLQNKDILTNNKKIISKIKNKRMTQNDSLYINVLSTNSMINNINKHLKIPKPIQINNYLDLTQNNKNNKDNKKNLFIKKNYY